MQPEIYPPFNPADTGRLRSETEALCEALRSNLQRLASEELSLEDIEEQFTKDQQPKAQALATAMLHYVPDNDPSIILLPKIGNVRTFKSDSLNMISEPLNFDIAETQLATVVEMLQKLLAYLLED